LLKTVGPMYVEQQKAKGMKLVDQDGKEVGAA
jgi:hypothetical protein